LLIEYNRGKPIALVEYKNEHALLPNRNHPSYIAITYLADSANIPFFLAQYTSDFTEFIITPFNYYAQQYFIERISMTEYQWVTFLYRLKGYQLPSHLERELKNGTPKWRKD